MVLRLRHGKSTVRKIKDALIRFWEKVELSDDGCWLWTGTVNGWGYGHFYAGNRNRPVRAHVWFWELLNGPLRPQLELDHLCKVRNCVNPAHLEPVPHRINVLRGTSPSAIEARQTHCKNGHEFTIENTQYDQGKRRCRTCRNAYARQRRAA